MDREKLFSSRKNGFDIISKDVKEAISQYSEDYKGFLNAGRTERECVKETIRLAEAKGFKEYTPDMELKPFDKIYFNNRDKNINLVVIGEKSLEKGVNIIASHIDSPRLDLKPNPLYEANGQALLKTHYYGGIRKYQWVTIPLELHGVVSLKGGKNVEVRIGEGEEPKLVITDLLPHLGQEQNKKPLGEAFTGEGLNILIGSEPIGDEKDSDRVKYHILSLLNDKYGIVEEDFISAELEAIPAYLATDIGLDRSMIGAYGHDDRVCSYAGLKAILELEKPEKTAVLILADKEEVGSMGVTGMISQNFERMIEKLCKGQNVSVYECFENSFCLSCDVTAALDPNYMEVFEDRNSARLNHGIALCKYTGSRGKGGASDANAETVGKIRTWFDEENILWQMAEMGKVDAGGGGTVALDLANRNIETIDAGVPVLSMHSPFEIVSKLDCYMTYKGCKAVFESK